MRVGVTPVGVEKHYRVAELVALWGFSRATITTMFAAEPDVMRWGTPSGNRKYECLSIPESVALRVHQRVCQQSLQASLAARNPPRIILLRNHHTRVTKQPTNVTDLKARKQLPDRECVA